MRCAGTAGRRRRSAGYKHRARDPDSDGCRLPENDLHHPVTVLFHADDRQQVARSAFFHKDRSIVNIPCTGVKKLLHGKPLEEFLASLKIALQCGDKK